MDSTHKFQLVFLQNVSDGEISNKSFRRRPDEEISNAISDHRFVAAWKQSDRLWRKLVYVAKIFEINPTKNSLK